MAPEARRWRQCEHKHHSSLTTTMLPGASATKFTMKINPAPRGDEQHNMEHTQQVFVLIQHIYTWAFKASTVDIQHSSAHTNQYCKLKEGRWRWNIRKNILLWWDTGRYCTEKLWMLHPWKCSRPDWVRFWAIQSSGTCPCPRQGGWMELGNH